MDLEFPLRNWEEYGKIETKKKWTGRYVRCLLVGNQRDDAVAGAVADCVDDALKWQQSPD